MSQPNSSESAVIVRRKRGFAILLTLMVLTLMVILITALLSQARMESIGARTLQGGVATQALNDFAVNVVIGQLTTGMTGTDSAGNRTASATQPGALRVYGENGLLFKGYKLYSDSVMVTKDEPSMAGDVPEADWYLPANRARYVDLNEPVSRHGTWHFPIIDPRSAASGSGITAPEGFSYTAAAAEGRILPQNPTDDKARLPMPVEWVYVLRDGNFGTLDASNRFQGAVQPSIDNPIVGRAAWWADDESCKINVNTSGEGNTWDTLRAVADEDREYSRYQPTRNEFSRYSGHPAMTSLSSVFFPGLVTNPSDINARKTLYNSHLEPLFQWMPRIAEGGSKAGTVVVDPRTTNLALLIQPDTDRLFATYDELVFSPLRATSSFVPPSRVSPWSFFLTATSRSPETTLFNTPRIPVWPVDASNRTRFHRTAFDQLVRFCATVGTNADTGKPAVYVIHRKNADSTTEDWNDPGEDITRNRHLFSYLRALTNGPIPGFGSSLSAKWGIDRDQILAEIIDYIRCTNLCDDNHPRLGYTDEENNAEAQTQFTNAWGGVNTNLLPDNPAYYNPTAHHWGHGQVAPLRINSPTGEVGGFGRFYTFSEAALHFICCADGDQGQEGGKSGTWGVATTNDLDHQAPETFYSNYPPLNPSSWSKIITENGVRKFAADVTVKPYGDNVDHPGYQPKHWNSMLPTWNNWHTGSPSTALKANQKRVQMMLHLEAFCPSMGYNQLVERMQLRISGLESLGVSNSENIQIFPTKTRAYNMGGDFGGGWHGRSWGGTAGFRGMMNQTRWRSQEDSMFSLPFTLPVGASTMDFKGGLVRIEIYSGHSSAPADLIQTINLKFPSAQLPIPDLCLSGSYGDPGIGPNGSSGYRDTGACFTFPQYWWTFDSRGCGGSYNILNPDGSSTGGEGSANPDFNYGIKWNNGLFYRRGRTDRVGSNPSYPWTSSNNPTPLPTAPARIHGQTHAAGMIRREDVIRSLVVPHGDMRLMTTLPTVPETLFQPYGNWSSNTKLLHLLYHNPAGPHWTPGFAGGDDTQHIPASINAKQLVKGANYNWAKLPDFPGTMEQTTGDFDNGISLIPDGPFINKPDEGNTQGLDGGGRPYLDGHWSVAALRPAYFSPNRIMPGPGMLGSLPTGIRRNIPWQTLLFRPASESTHPGASRPPDHLVLDNFWMPVVQPYAISEPFSTSGKINLNYQILPFSYINRSTGLHAILKNERVTAIPTTDGNKYKNWDHELADYVIPASPGKYRYPVNMVETLKQFESKFFTKKSLFRTATEVCDIHLVPDKPGATHDNMTQFWKDHALTGDNTRERPYTNILGRLTTKSSTFTVHTRVQVLRKARSTDPAVFDPDQDAVLTEYRGSTTVERFIDPNNNRIPDYAPTVSPINFDTITPLDQFYRFRVASQKRFQP